MYFKRSTFLLACFQKKVEKRGRKLIDYDSARHTLDGAKGKKDEARLAKVS